MKYINQEGHLSDEGFALYAEAIKLNKVTELPDDLTAHLDTCRKCQQDLVDFSAIMLDIDQPELTTHPASEGAVIHEQKKEARRISLFVRYAAAAAVLLLLFFTYQKYQGSSTPEIVKQDKEKPEKPYEAPKTKIVPSEDNTIVQATDPEKASDTIQQIEGAIPEDKTPGTPPANRQLYAANFEINEDFESLVGTTFRSENFKAIAPVNNKAFKPGSMINFSWEGTVPLNLIILDNEEDILFEKTVESLSFNWTQQLEPGLYYWKLETEDDLLHLGKFTIE